MFERKKSSPKRRFTRVQNPDIIPTYNNTLFKRSILSISFARTTNSATIKHLEDYYSGCNPRIKGESFRRMAVGRFLISCDTPHLRG